VYIKLQEYKKMFGAMHLVGGSATFVQFAFKNWLCKELLGVGIVECFV
jgi:hypothetical protein